MFHCHLVEPFKFQLVYWDAGEISLLFWLALVAFLSVASPPSPLPRKPRYGALVCLCCFLSPSVGTREVQDSGGADVVQCVLRLGGCVHIPTSCREPFPYPSLRLGSEMVSVEEMMLGSAGPRWGGSNQQLNSALQKTSCRSSNLSVHLVGEN